MRPVNLLPPEQRRGGRAPMRTGPLAYVVVAVLAAALVAVTLLVMTNNRISDREAEKASLEAQVAQAEAEAQRLASFASFASLQQAREETVSNLARSRFDWERVLRELAIVIPDGVWLTSLNAAASPGVGSSSASASTSDSSSASGVGVEGPSLQIEGCAAGHEAVAGFLAALQDIDGVTRVSVLKSDQPELASPGAAAAAATGETAGADTGCSTRDFVSTFEVVAAFDAVQIGADAQEPTPATPTTETTSTTSTARKADDTFVPGTGTGP